jgi:hypothetical protein
MTHEAESFHSSISYRPKVESFFSFFLSHPTPTALMSTGRNGSSKSGRGWSTIERSRNGAGRIGRVYNPLASRGANQRRLVAQLLRQCQRPHGTHCQQVTAR